ncbi:biotin/lipoyl-binding protein [Paraclostridium bifermentans]|jgi:biotin carboxyl carrier protein|uniref:biotin/lipoyl-containing protein n=1 Tax=Paraclostridium bifermentans TaxID=1490 RepID=UPI000ADA36F6
MIKKYNITVNGNTYEVEVEELGSQASVQRPQVATQQVQPQAAPKAQPKQTQNTPSAGGGTISAPMPGTINDVRVKVGDSVKKGQVLLILEAMKMENEIMASSDGTVKSVDVSKGASVSAGDALITIG